MNASGIEALNQRFGLSGDEYQVYFKEGKGGIPVVEVRNAGGKALISCQGAHLLSWIPSGQDEVIWLSSDACFAEEQSVRGGIPVCWPWFGAHSVEASFPSHGFARTVLWEVRATRQLDSGETQISFGLNTGHLHKRIQQMCPEFVALEYTLTIGASLVLMLTTHNHGVEDMVIGEALHTYFNVGDVNNTCVMGLEGKEYLDKPDGFKCKKQVGAIRINEEVDRVYIKTKDELVIDNQKRKIVITKQGSNTSIVWNPWKAVAEKMADLGHDGYLNMLCVESGNAAEDVVTVAAGESHTLQVTYRLEDV